ncbi:MAG TPA: maleylpyruvate isomerase N-terminal domain-containing protein [Saprospiraceae bacterium]
MSLDVPIPTVHLIPELDQLLIELLKSLSVKDWSKQTLSPAWNVKDVAAHLLDGNVRSLSSSRDDYRDSVTPDSNGLQDVVKYLNTINQDWVKAMKRVSPAVLIALLEITNPSYSDHLKSLPPFEKAIFSVAWAGESESQNWFHIAREYTEKWHHQQQIREAIGGASPLFEERFFKPYLDTSLRALPYYLNSVYAENGDTFSLFVTGPGGGEYHLEYNNGSWAFSEANPTYSVTKVHIDDQVIWRLFSRQISQDELTNRAMISGKKEPAEAFLKMKAVMV